LTQKEYWNLYGIIYLIYVHKKNIGIYRVFLYIVVDTERIIGYIGYYLLIVVDTERILDI